MSKIKSITVLRAQHLELQKAGDSDNYYELKNAFNEEIKKYLRSGNESCFFKLKTRDVLQLLDWFSSYRPYEPHQILTRLSIINDMCKLGDS